jgi:hypothetical protein
MLEKTKRYLPVLSFLLFTGLFLPTVAHLDNQTRERRAADAASAKVITKKPTAKSTASPKPKPNKKITASRSHKNVSRSRAKTATYIPPANQKPRPVNGQPKCESWEDWTTPCGKNQRIGHAQAADRGWTGRQWVCLKKLWYRESGWSKNSGSPDGGAFGIPQALPGSKMASAGSDWRTNAATQIKWGLGYISGRYGSPCSAYAHWQSHSWY